MYNFSISLKDNFDTAVKRVTEALQQEKFGILNEINIHTVLKSKLNVDIPPHRILHACNPSVSQRLLGKEPNISVLLPCNVVVREETDGTTTVVFMDPVPVFELTNNPEAVAIAKEVKEMLMRARDKLV